MGFWPRGTHISEDPGPRDGAQGWGGIRGAHISEDPRPRGAHISEDPGPRGTHISEDPRPRGTHISEDPRPRGTHISEDPTPGPRGTHISEDPGSRILDPGSRKPIFRFLPQKNQTRCLGWSLKGNPFSDFCLNFGTRF